MNKILGLLAMTAIFMLLLTPAVCLISTEEAEQTALKYKGPDEYTYVYGPYSYLGHFYYFAEYIPVDDESLISAAMVIDSETGKIIENKEIAEKIILTHVLIAGVSSPQTMTYYEEDAAYYKELEEIMEENVKVIEESAAVMKDTTKFKNFTAETEAMKEIYKKLSENRNNMLTVAKKTNAGEKSYENALEIKKLNEEYVEILETFLEKNKDYREQVAVYYDAGNTIGYNSDRYAWNNAKEKRLEFIDSLSELAADEYETEKEYAEATAEYLSFLTDVYEEKAAYGKETPGFGIFFAVAAVLVGSVLIKRKKS